ncbi:MAG TPA: hypothetical protein VIH69_05885 [Dehalococcoidia bacterium]
MAAANIRDEGLRDYLKSFHETLQSTADQYLLPEYHKRLLHLSFLPATIKGYVSTQFGIAIEYLPSDSTSIEIVTGSQRIEDLLFQAPKKIRDIGPLFNVVGAMCSFTNLQLEGAFPIRLTKETASISLFDMSFQAGQWKRTVHYAQLFGYRKADDWSAAQAVARAKDEVLAALVEVQRAGHSDISLDQYIASHKARTVLVLGDYGVEGLVRLDAIVNELKSLKYEPILIKDVPDHPHQDISQKVVAIGAIARFVIVDDSSNSGHLMEIPICKQNNWVTILMRLDGKGGSWMTAGASSFSNVILELPYDRNSIRDALIEGTKWAEEKIGSLEQTLSGIYPWRQSESFSKPG